MQNHIKSYCSILATCFVALTACDEDTIEADLGEKGDTLSTTITIPAPIVRLVESKVPTTLKFGFSVTAEQAQDTVYYLVLPDSATVPSANNLLNHADITELPMQGSHFRSTFRSDLSAQTKYVVYAVIKKGKALSEVSSLTLATGSDTASSGNPTDSTGNGGQENPPTAENPPTQPAPTENPPPTTNPQDTTAAPVLEPRGTPQDDLISLAVLVNGDQIEGTLHYLYFTESKNPGMPTSQELVDHRLTQTVPMNGATIKKFNFPATGKTNYYIYAVLQLGNKLSRVVLLERATI